MLDLDDKQPDFPLHNQLETLTVALLSVGDDSIPEEAEKTLENLLSFADAEDAAADGIDPKSRELTVRLFARVLETQLWRRGEDGADVALASTLAALINLGMATALVDPDKAKAFLGVLQETAPPAAVGIGDPRQRTEAELAARRVAEGVPGGDQAARRAMEQGKPPPVHPREDDGSAAE